ncbi:MAG: diacylglycerol kinase family protein [Chloroflexota bacterium]|nr:diacylglycerol kinase family protein [Chloroflexota bacterium]
MKGKTIHLHLAVFNGKNSAEAALGQVPKRDPDIASAVVMEKDADERVQFRDVGLTPKKGAVGGIVLGGMIGLLTGGAGLALAAAGGILGSHLVQKKQVEQLEPERLSQVAGSLGPDSSAIIGISKNRLDVQIAEMLEAMGAELYETTISGNASGEMEEHADEAYDALLAALAKTTGGQTRLSIPYPKIHVVLNPVSGKDEPVINVLNRVFNKYGVDWDISITRKYGDATEFARQAAESGFDLVAGYGGDGTQHEIANGVMGTGVTMGVLPGGTGNGFANELGIPKTLEPAVELLCTSHNQRKIDVAQLEDGYFIQRLFTGIEPDEQTSREDKDKYGTLAYLKRDINRLSEIQDIPYRLTIDGEVIEVMGHKCYVVNSAKAGTGLSLAAGFTVDDGILDVFILSQDLDSIDAALTRFLDLDNPKAGEYYWRGQEIRIEVEPDQPVWTDGEYTGRTPVSIKVLPAALTVAVP